MAVDDIRPWRPDWTVSPGEVLVEALADRGITQSELARRLARPQKTINEIANGKAAITPETAIQLERALGISADLWLGLETRYRADLARTSSDLELEAFGEWAEAFPLKMLKAHNLISADSGLGAAGDLLRFFGVSSPAGWSRHWGAIAASYRMSGSARVSRESVSAWLRWSEIEADRLEVSDFDGPGLIKTLRESRTLTRKAIFSQALEDLQARLARVGVAMVILPSLPHAPASGAARWHRGRGLVTLSLRYLSDDQLWHSVYHEVGHLVRDRRGKSVIEEIGPGAAALDEASADQFARDLLIPGPAWATFISGRSFSRRKVEEFAKDQGIATGIVVGRLQHDDWLRPSQLNDLKRRLEPLAPSAEVNEGLRRRERSRRHSDASELAGIHPLDPEGWEVDPSKYPSSRPIRGAQEDDLKTAKVSPWHSIKQMVHHNNTNCNTGNNMESQNRREGTGGKPLCAECARLS